MKRLWKATGNRNKVLELFQIGNGNDDAQPGHSGGLQGGEAMASVPIAYALERKVADQRLEPRAYSLEPVSQTPVPDPLTCGRILKVTPSIVTALRLHRMD
jgi:hypothetical protein